MFIRKSDQLVSEDKSNKNVIEYAVSSKQSILFQL